MASSATYKQPCVKCEKGGGVATCGGCQQWFCTKHFGEHRQELDLEMEHLSEEHDLLQQDLEQRDDVQALLSHVDDWEQTSIGKIQAAAEQARVNIRKYQDYHKQHLKSSLHQMADKLKLGRQLDDYTELDLEQWLKQMKEIREMLEKQATIGIIDDNEPQSIIHLIQVKPTKMSNKTISSSENNPSEIKSDDGIDHPQSSQENILHSTNKSTHAISTVDKQNCKSNNVQLSYICQSCGRKFLNDNNSGGDCIHRGTWHAKYEDCSYLKCGFNLGIKAAIGKRHWSCCYSLEQDSNVCSQSEPHSIGQHENSH